MTFPIQQLVAAHKHTIDHRPEIERSATCGCFYCKSNYPPSTIERWLEEGSGTALCPRCDIDSVIGSASGFPVADEAFLEAMHEYWFERTVHVAN